MANRKEYELAIKIAGEIEKSLPKSMRTTKAELRALAKEAVNSSNATKGAFSSSTMTMTGSLKKVNQVSNKVFKTLTKGAKIAGAAVGAGLGAAVKVGMEYEAQMSTVQAISGATNEEMERLSEAAEKYGATTSFTARESGQALEYMSLAGYDAEKSIAMLPNVLNLAAAGQMELARASDQVTDASSALGLSTEDTTKLIDQMALTSSKTNTSVEQLGDGILKIGGTAKILSGGTTELNEVLGLLADNGIKGAEGGTHLRNILLSLTAPTDKAAGVIDELGLTIADKEGNLRSMADIMTDLNNELSGMSKTERTKTLKKIFNKTDIQSVNALLGTSTDRWSDLANMIDDSTGAARKMADTKLDNLQGDVTLFKSALEGTGITIYKELQGPLRSIVQTGTEKVQEFSSWFVDNFPQIKRGISDVGEALMNLAQPFLSIGGWLLENPEVMAGALGAIGSAIITFKVASGISSVATAISTLLSLHPAIAIIGGVAAGIGALAAASATAARKAKQNNLADHFGDLTLSLEELEDAAKQIVGAKDLEGVNNLLSALGEEKNIRSAMDDALSAINKVNWKINAGLTISENDTKSYVEDVKDFVSNAQKIVDQRGYEVSISTKLLFGDSDKASDMLKADNEFYAGLDSEMQNLSDTLNSYLEDALKNGLTPDTQETIDSILNAMSEITDAVTNAESQAEWDMLSGQWSGKDLTADNFEELQNQINETLEKEYQGIDEATKTQYTSINARLSRGDITQEEALKQKEDVASAAEAKRTEASNRAVGFQYNTLMNTYADEFASGSIYNSQDTRDAVNELVNKILEAPGANTSEYGTALRTIQHASAYDTSLAGNLNFFNPFGTGGENSALAAGFSGSVDSFTQAQSAVVELGRAYKSADPAGTMEKDYQTAEKNIGDGMNSTFQGIGDQAATYGTVMGVNIANSMINSANPIIQSGFANMFNNATTSTPVTIKTITPTIKKHAKGGIFNKPHVGMVGEAGTESIIPIKKTKQSLDLYNQTGAMLGVSNGGFALTVNITVNGNTDPQKVATLTSKEFKKLYNKMVKDSNRVSLA